MSVRSKPSRPIKLLITAGPTHEPIDAVRYLANRSSGRLGIALAEQATERGWEVRLLLGPTPRECDHTGVRTIRFQTTADLQGLLTEHFAWADVLVMAAAVADYRPKSAPGATATKLRRTDQKLQLELEPTPDLLAQCASLKRPDQFLVGFALEPRDRLMESARNKLKKKHLDLIVANPLETMDATTIEATVLSVGGDVYRTDSALAKAAFAPWLLGIIEAQRSSREMATDASSKTKPAHRVMR